MKGGIKFLKASNLEALRLKLPLVQNKRQALQEMCNVISLLTFRSLHFVLNCAHQWPNQKINSHWEAARQGFIFLPFCLNCECFECFEVHLTNFKHMRGCWASEQGRTLTMWKWDASTSWEMIKGIKILTRGSVSLDTKLLHGFFAEGQWTRM